MGTVNGAPPLPIAPEISVIPDETLLRDHLGIEPKREPRDDKIGERICGLCGGWVGGVAETNWRLVFFNATPGCRVHPDERCRPVRTNSPPLG